MKTGRVILCLAAALLGVSGALATDGTWMWGASGQPAATSPQTAADWSSSGNWQDGAVASGSDAVALVPQRGYPFISVDSHATIGRLFPSLSWYRANWSNIPRYIGSGSFSFSRTTGDDKTEQIGGAAFYVPVSFTDLLSGRRVSLSYVEFCAPLTCPKDALIQAIGGDIYFRRDRWADDASAVIRNAFPTNEIDFWADYTIRYVAPQGADGVTGTWDQTAGSAYLTRSQTAAHALAVGTLVTGAGIPSGTYLKRVFSDSMIELSQAATTTASANALSFAAFTPDMEQSVASVGFISRSSRNTATLCVDKYRAADRLMVTVGKVENAENFAALRLDALDGFVPGLLVLRDTAACGADLILGNCHVRFEGATPGWTKAGAMMETATDVARVTIPAGTAATFAALTNLVGTLVKDGTGSLTAPVSGAAAFNGSTGAIAVEAGQLALTADASAAAPHLKHLTLASDATFTIPACGLYCERLTAESGAQILGAGVFYLGYGEDISGVTFGPDVKVVRYGDSRVTIREEDYLAEIPGAATAAEIVALKPALWVDLTKSETVTAASGRLSKLADVRGDGYGYTSNQSGNAPYVVTNSSGAVSHLYIPHSGTDSKVNAYCVDWSATVTGIRSVFKAIYTINGGGQLLGDSNYWRNSRTEDLDAPLFGNVPESYTNDAVFFVNGETRDWRLGYPYVGGTSTRPVDKWIPTVVEFYPPDATMKMKGFGWGSSYLLGHTDQASKGVNGGDRMGECLVFTNELTMVQKVAIRRYLMEKWFKGATETGHEPNLGRGVAEQDVSSDPTAEVLADTALVVDSLAGAGTLTKTGAGTLYVSDASQAGVSLAVKEGRVSVRSANPPTAATLPDGRAIHLDAEASGTLTDVGKETMSWSDVRGAGYPTASVQNFKSGLRVVTLTNDVALGHSFLDFGEANDNRSSINCAYMLFPELLGVRTAFSVLDVISSTKRSGGQLLGGEAGDGAHLYFDNYDYYGLYRVGTDGHMVYPSHYGAANHEMMRSEHQAGRASFRLNRADVVPTAQTLGDGCNLFACDLYEPINAQTLGVVQYSSGKWCSGGALLGEAVYYTNKLSQAHYRAVEAYLAKKWYAQDTAGFRPAQFDALTVAAGATVVVTGGEPLTVGTLGNAGTVVGPVKLTAGATIEASVLADGSVSCGAFTTAMDLSSGGAIRVVSGGTVPKAGVYELLPASGALGEWTITATGFRGMSFSAFVRDGKLCLRVAPQGFAFFFK